MHSVSNQTKRDARETARLALKSYLLELVGDGPIPRFEEALTHPSYANETPVKDNQRLEFAGDAILSLCVCERLLAVYPTADEGVLTRMRSALVNTEALARWARTVDLGPCLALGKGAEEAGESRQERVLADTVEALVAAVYDARGLQGARLLVAVIAPTEGAKEGLGEQDPKSSLQERVQGRKWPTPVYRLVETTGKSHEQHFVIEVWSGGAVLGRGEGSSKKRAERAAAQDALQGLLAGTRRG